MRRLLPLLLVALPAFTEEAAKPRVRLDVRYDKAQGVAPNLLSLDVYAPAEEGPHPVLVFIHGGGWRGGDKANDAAGLDKASYFLSEGFVYVSVNYRLSPAVKHPTHVKDVARAIALVHERVSEYGGDPERLYVMGHSAGAHLAALVATDERRLGENGTGLDAIRGVILLDGAGYDIPWLLEGGRAMQRALYTNAFGEEPEGWKDASPISHIAKGKGIPPFLIIHIASREDSRLQSERLAEALEKAGITAEVRSAEGKTHGTLNRDIGREGDEPTKWVMEFLRGE